MLTIGAATRIITNDIGGYVQSATAVSTASEIRDELEANALFLTDGATQVLLVSCDLVGLETDVVVRAREAAAAAVELDARDIIICCTHTHSGPSLIPTNYQMPLDHEYMDCLVGWLAEVATAAVRDARPGRIAWGIGEARAGFNRRCCWADGSHSMHGDTTRADFTGLEGPDDTQHMALFVTDGEGKLRALLHHNTGHPTNFFNAGLYSADFPGESRRELREQLGDIPILFLNGAFGDICLGDLVRPELQRRESRLQTLARVSHALTGETLRLLHLAEFADETLLRHDCEDLKIPVRLPDEECLASSKELLERVDRGEKVAPFDVIFAYGSLELQRRFGADPVDTVSVHAVRIGGLALVTQPCELFCQFGIDIKRRSPAKATAVVGLADGYGGYCPTLYGIMGGGYSGKPITWCRLAAEGGYMIVDSGARLAHRLWHNDCG